MESRAAHLGIRRPHRRQLIYSSVLKNEDRVDQGGVEGSSLSAGQETDEVG